jgi:hypothetical protein
MSEYIFEEFPILKGLTLLFLIVSVVTGLSSHHFGSCCYFGRQMKGNLFLVG